MVKLSVGLIGCGGIATRAHVPALQRLSALVRVRSVCDIRAAVAESVSEALGANWTTDYRVLLDDSEIQAVVITTPEFLHAEQTLAAVQAGKHVLCEKPMARTLAEADAMIAAARTAGVQLMIAHSRRFTARYRQAHELLEAGAIGQPVLVRENERRPRTAGPGVPVSGWQPDPDKQTTWYAQARYAAGTAFHIGVHEMDLLRWFAGSEARSVYMESKITDPNQEVPDTVTLQVQFENGALGACDIFTQAQLAIQVITSSRSSAPRHAPQPRPGFAGAHPFRLRNSQLPNRRGVAVDGARCVRARAAAVFRVDRARCAGAVRRARKPCRTRAGDRRDPVVGDWSTGQATPEGG